MALRPLIWDFHLRGSAEVKSELAQVGQATRVATRDSDEHSKSLRQEARDANLLIHEEEYRARILIAQHPVLLRTVQAVGYMTSVLRTLTAVMMLYNTAQLLVQGANAEMLTTQDQLSLEQSKLNDMQSQGMEGSIAYQEQQEKVNELYHTMAEQTQQAANAQSSMAMEFAIGATMMAGTIVGILAKSGRFLGFFERLSYLRFGVSAFAETMVGFGATTVGVLRTVGAAMLGFISANPWVLIAIAAVAAAVLIITHWKEISEFLTNVFTPVFQFVQDHWRELLIALTGGVGLLAVYMIDHWNEISQTLTNVWNSLRLGFIGLWNSFATVANAGIGGITKGIEIFVNAAVDALNVLIRAYNSAVAIVGGKGIGLISHITLSAPQIPMISAAAGFSGVVNQPTLFLAGEAGQSERVQIGAPSGGSGGNKTVIIQVGGSIWEYRNLREKLMQDFDHMLQDRGF